MHGFNQTSKHLLMHKYKQTATPLCEQINCLGASHYHSSQFRSHLVIDRSSTLMSSYKLFDQTTRHIIAQFNYRRDQVSNTALRICIEPTSSKSRPPALSPFIMCYHKYTHYPHCDQHIPMHTHMCPKNITDDQTRVIFCEDYQAIRVEARSGCPHCEHQHSQHHQTRASSSFVTTPTSSVGLHGYPTPPKTATPGSTR